jgi:hypothetical protein
MENAGRIAYQLVLFPHHRQPVMPPGLACLPELYLDVPGSIVIACYTPFEAERNQCGGLDREFAGHRAVLCI